MRRRIVASGLTAGIIAAGLSSASPFPRPSSQAVSSAVGRTVSYVEGEVLVKFRPTASPARAAALLRTAEARISGRLARREVYRLKIGPGQTVEDAIRLFRANPDVLYAEANPILRLASIEPNDPYFLYQWGLRNSGQVIGPPYGVFPRGKAGSDIKASQAWGINCGAEVIVAVIDTGVQLRHPDLWRKIEAWGPDYVELDDEPDDAHGHGTLIAGIIGADTDNGEGVSGISWGARILPIRAFDGDARSDVFKVSDAIIWAADNGARVINMSFGGSDIENNLTLRSAVEYARIDKDIVLAASAGNDGIEDVWFPAAYEDVVIGVAATDYDDVYQTLSTTGGLWGSNYGPAVDLAAPGVHILSTWPLGQPLLNRLGWEGYAYGEKTSMSTAFVSGAAALLRGHRPDLTAGQIETILFRAADDLNAASLPGRDLYLGWGRLNLLRTFHYLEPLLPPLHVEGAYLPASGLRPRSFVVLTWEDNPDNEDGGLEKYRVYSRDGQSRILLAEVGADVHRYVAVLPGRGTSITFEVAGMSDVEIEGQPAIAAVPDRL